MHDRPPWHVAVLQAAILDRLQDFDPRVVGTPPLGLAVEGSDIDVVCEAGDLLAFTTAVWTGFAEQEGFSVRQWRGEGRPVVARFCAHGWPFEIFGAARPVEEQAGWRHFTVERRLLALGGERLRSAVMAYRASGLKTEPAFAAALGLQGDPYAALLTLYDCPDRSMPRLPGGGTGG
ncbi:DUF4269 domain-containing protein [Reyranella sp.]|uniref:DUF4269 domain-containing protein n=1 Tax=Reyranella sp. TaxID=1929291 RepID=UPI003BAA3DDD